MARYDTFTEQIRAIAKIAEEAYESGQFGELDEALIAAIDACPSASLLGKLLSTTPIDDALYGEDVFAPSVARALLRKAATLGPSDGAVAVGLAARASGFDFAPYLCADPDDGLKADFLDELEANAAFLWQGLASTDAKLRAACTEALAHRRSVVPDDVDRLCSAISEEKVTEPIAGLFLALGAAARRLATAESAAPVTQAADRFVEHESVLVRACAAAAIALATRRSEGPWTRALAEALRAPATVPAVWSWRWKGGRGEKSGVIPIRLLQWIECIPRREAIEAVKAQPDPLPGSSEALLHLAFDASLPRLGPAVDELDEDQRAAVRGLARMPNVYVHLYRLGLVLPQYVEPFLAGDEPGWRPLEVATSEGIRRWHLWRIWRAYMWDDIGEEAAVDAVMQIPPGDLLRAITHDHRNALTSITGLPREELHVDRDLRLLVAVVGRLIERGFDVMKAADELTDDPSRDPTGVATVFLAASTFQGGEIADSHDSLLVTGLRRSSSKRLPIELLACLPEERRERILEQVAQA